MVTSRPETPLSSRSRLTHDQATFAVVAAAVLIAWLLRFVIDDAYISFRYAKNLAEGRGLIFNPGERVEGYTNYLWTLMIAAGLKVGLNPATLAHLLTLISTGVATLATIRIADLLGGRRPASIWGGVLLSTNAAFVSFGTSGLETMFQTALLAAVAWIVFAVWDRPPRAIEIAGVSVLAAAAFLTRLDSALVLGVLLVAWLWHRRAAGAPLRELVTLAGGVAAVPIATAAPWFAWRFGFYDAVLPNTFYAKETDGFTPMGAIFLGLFVVSYFWFGPALAILLKARVWTKEPGYLAAGLIVGLWAAYVVYAGGDWMDWRFLVAVMPFMFLVAARAIEAIARPALRVAAVATCIAGSVLHGAAYPSAFNVDGLSTVRLLTEQPPPNWVTEGEALRKYFPGGLDQRDQVTIAVVAAGAIPYFSELPAIDMIGLTDAEVARHGDLIHYSSGISKPGHVRMAKFDYLRERSVNLVIGIPVTVEPDELKDSYSIDDPIFFTLFHEATIGLQDLGPDPKLVAIPVDGRLMLAVYLTPHPSIERHIENGWRTVPVTEGDRG